MLYYIHGYLSSPDSTKGSLFKKELDAIAIKYRDCKPEDLVISDCLKTIEKTINNDDNVFLIGSSLGGFLAAKTALHHSNVKKLILINPALIPPSVDINNIQDLPINILSEMQDFFLFKEKILADIHILVGIDDDVVPIKWSIEFAKVQEAIIHFFQDDHRFLKNLDKLPTIISRIIKY